MASQKADLAYGEQNEMSVMDRLNEAFKTELERFGGYATIDYANPTRSIWVELKSRRIRHNQYPTALIGANKVAFCQKNDEREYYFVFHYLDGLYYIKYNKDLFDSFQKEAFKRGERADAAYNGPQDIYHIPVEHLEKLPKCIFV